MPAKSLTRKLPPTPQGKPRDVEYVPLSSIKMDPRNPKDHDVDLLDGSVGRFGYIDPMVRDDRTGYLISGHGRAKTLHQMHERGEDIPDGILLDPDSGEWLVPVGVGWASRSDAEAKAALITLNRTSEVGGWVDGTLLELLDELSDIEGGLDAVGFNDGDIDQLRSYLSTHGMVHDYDEEDDEDEDDLAGTTMKVMEEHLEVTVVIPRERRSDLYTLLGTANWIMDARDKKAPTS